MASNGRVAQWLYSNKNMAGCVLALGAPVLAVTGLVAPPVALVLLPVLYAAGALAAPGRGSVDLVSGLDPNDVARSLKTIRKKIAGKVNQAISIRVDRICGVIDHVLRANELDAGSDEMHVLVRMATDYLPATLEPYLALPRMYAEHKVVSDGKTAAQILCDQLDVMSERMEAISDAVARADADRLLANGRFLAEKFGQTGLALPPEPGPDGGPADAGGGGSHGGPDGSSAP